MKKLVCIAIVALSAAAVAQNSTSQSSQSLGDVARKSRAEEQKAPAKKVYTNDDFAETPAPAPSPTADAKATAGTPSLDEAPKPGSAQEKGQPSVDLSKESSTTSGDTKDKKDAKPNEEKDAKASAEDQAKVDAEWKSKIDAQKSKISGLQREYDLTDREYKLFATTFYADAGNRLRDQKDFHDKETDYRDKLGNLKQQITDEQAKLAELQDQAHKAGANKAYD